jgi:hypothetical protein
MPGFGLTFFEQLEIFVSLKAESSDIVADYKDGDIIINGKHDRTF